MGLILPRLNQLGSQGWELVTFESIATIAAAAGETIDPMLRNSLVKTYLCIFKRRKA